MEFIVFTHGIVVECHKFYTVYKTHAHTFAHSLTQYMKKKYAEKISGTGNTCATATVLCFHKRTRKLKVDLCGDDSNHANVIKKNLIEKRITEPEQVYYWEIPEQWMWQFQYIPALLLALRLRLLCFWKTTRTSARRFIRMSDKNINDSSLKFLSLLNFIL